MDLDKIRKMSDDDLKKWLKQLSKRTSTECVKCGKDINYVVKIENLKTYQTKKLCGLCESCYQDFLESLDVFDVPWDM